jgi:hydrogenase maturation protein HypF
MDRTTRHRIAIRGAVQGVGFRPFVHRLARGMGLCGFVGNDTGGVVIEIDATQARADEFLHRLDAERPALSRIYSLEHLSFEAAGGARYSSFEIRASESAGAVTVPVLPDIATCPQCRAEIRDPRDRRYRYPFTNCTHCGPRFTIVEALPYDRANTTMKGFAMCERCRAEYDDPGDRRYHAQPIACPDCGPRLSWWDVAGNTLATGDDALAAAERAIREGLIVAVKGLGGFHLVVDARDRAAVMHLRHRKHRDEKPFAIMAPSLDWVRTQCVLSEAEERALLSPESPIVLARRAGGDEASDEVTGAVAPHNPFLGVMLPYTPLHHLLMDDLDFAVVATSGNVAEETICTDEHAALDSLADIADYFLVHDRPIARHADDSIVRAVAGRMMLVRRARGYAPLPLPLATVDAVPAGLAVGAHQKNVVGIAVGGRVVLGQHIGDLSTGAANSAFERCVSDLALLYRQQPEWVAYDAHPDYRSTRFALALGVTPIGVQHHAAHVASCMAENELDGPALGVSWDGTGYGTDGTVWGGEFLRVEAGRLDRFSRFAHLRTFRLPGGERAVREPRRSALGVFCEMSGADALAEVSPAVAAFAPGERRVLARMIAGGVNAPVTSSAGRLFDAVASLVGLRHVASFEGQAAMELEFLAHRGANDACYAFDVGGGGGALRVDWGPTIRAILDDVALGTDVAAIAASFHNTLAEMIVGVAKRCGEAAVVLTGGCFQNAYLTERTVTRLRAEGFRPVWHRLVPPNDGGIALGQIVIAAAKQRAQREES